jgi:microcystin-dependent protein
MDPFLGEIRMFGGSFAPVGWALCNGQLLPISQNDTLFALIGTTYGGDGQSTFALPDLRGRLPLHQGSGYPIGQSGGLEEVLLTSQTTPAHTHQLSASQTASSNSPANTFLAPNPDTSILQFGGDEPVPYPPNLVTAQGGSQPHENRQPFLCVNFIIALEGIFPSQS